MKTNITISYFHLFISKEYLDILPPGNFASAISRQGRIGQHHLQYFHIASSSPEFLDHNLNCTSSTGTRQTRLRMRCEEKFSYSHRILPGQGLSRHCSISTISASGQGAPPWAEAVQARPRVLDISMSIRDTSLVRGWWKIKDGCYDIFTH